MDHINKRITIGVLVSGILDEFTQHICSGIMTEAKSCDADILIIPGKYLDRDLSHNRELMYEYQYVTAFSYIRKGSVDALIIAADCIGCFASKENIQALLHQYDGIPCVLIASKADGYVNVTFDNYNGIREGLEYLIQTCGYRRIGMVGGTDNNTDARERKEAFRRVLADHGIEWTDRRFTEGNLSRTGRDAYRTLLDENPDLEAVFCVNDATAFGLYDELKRRGLKPGKDISVLGFDDSIAAAQTSPSLSSVRADPNQLGEAAVRTVLSILRGNAVSDTVIPTRFVLRDSICQPKSPANHCLHILNCLDTSFHDIFYRNYHAQIQGQTDRLNQAYKTLFNTLAGHFRNPPGDLYPLFAVSQALDDFLSLGGAAYADVDALLTVLEELYYGLLELQPDANAKFELRNTFSMIYRKLIRALNRQSAAILNQEYRTNYAMKLFVQNILQFEHGDEQSYCTLLQNLEWLQIRNAGLYLLPEPTEHLFPKPFTAPDLLYLKAVLSDGTVHPVSPELQKVSLSDLFTHDRPAADTSCCRVLLPLFFGTVVYGVLLCDMTELLFTNGEFLVNQLSSALKMITLLRTNQDIQARLEDNLASLKDHNIELDTLSKSDPLTGILNRRGFYSRAEELLAAHRANGHDALIIYADMNNLKRINDQYGHKEGDSSLKQIALILAKLVSGRGIAGRIGGDEFACLLELRGPEREEEILARLYRMFDDYNRLAAKPYALTVSAGACAVTPDTDLTLKNALMLADQKLYEEKKHRNMHSDSKTGRPS